MQNPLIYIYIISQSSHRLCSGVDMNEHFISRLSRNISHSIFLRFLLTVCRLFCSVIVIQRSPLSHTLASTIHHCKYNNEPPSRSSGAVMILHHNPCEAQMRGNQTDADREPNVPAAQLWLIYSTGFCLRCFSLNIWFVIFLCRLPRSPELPSERKQTPDRASERRVWPLRDLKRLSQPGSERFRCVPLLPFKSLL